LDVSVPVGKTGSGILEFANSERGGNPVDDAEWMVFR
jgi:hypothetical protein